MSRDEISMDILKAVNGVGDGCGIFFHGMTSDEQHQFPLTLKQMPDRTFHSAVPNFEWPSAPLLH